MTIAGLAIAKQKRRKCRDRLRSPGQDPIAASCPGVLGWVSSRCPVRQGFSDDLPDVSVADASGFVGLMATT